MTTIILRITNTTPTNIINFMTFKKSNIVDVAIIGGGASGMAAAITAAKISIIKNNKTKIAIYESSEKIGKSILKTGNGRCNFSNYFINENKGSLYNNKKFCNTVFNSCDEVVNKNKIFGSNEEISAPMQMFEDLGLACYCDDEGKMFPYTNKASSVVDVLKYEINDLEIDVYNNSKFINLKKEKNSNFYKLFFEEEKIVYAKKIIFAVGHEKLSNKLFFKNSVSFNKILGPIKTDTKYLRNLDGIKVHVKASIYNSEENELSSETGELLFRKYGISGICVFNLSRFLFGKNQKIEIDFAPEDEFDNLLTTIKFRYNKFKMNNNIISAERLFAGMILPQIIKNLCDFAKVDKNNVKNENLKTLCSAIKSFKLKAYGIADEKQCQVCRGGIKTSALDQATMALKECSDIYFVGEAVDVDGPCGGYNLHWAWASGILAGASSIIV